MPVSSWEILPVSCGRLVTENSAPSRFKILLNLDLEIFKNYF